MKMTFSFFLSINPRCARQLLEPHDTLSCVLIHHDSSKLCYKINACMRMQGCCRSSHVQVVCCSYVCTGVHNSLTVCTLHKSTSNVSWEIYKMYVHIYKLCTYCFMQCVLLVPKFTIVCDMFYIYYRYS